MMYMYPPTTSDGPSLPPPPEPVVPRKRQWVKIGLLASAVLILTLAGATALVATRASSLTLKERTDKIGNALESGLCDHSKTYSTCKVKTKPGDIEVDLDLMLDVEDRLDKVGENTGLWTSADASRMMRTRPVDGMEKTSDGRVSWTYDSKDGLQIVITVTDSTPVPTTGSAAGTVA